MKKKLIILAGSLMVLAIGATTYFSVNTNSGMSLLMQNVEALAGSENLADKVWDVYQRPDGTGPNCIQPGSEACK